MFSLMGTVVKQMVYLKDLLLFFEANLGKKTNLENKPLIHFVERDAYEKYVMVFTGTGVEVYDLQGNQKTVKYQGTLNSTYILRVQDRF